jgi:predicted transposase YbfD/YdcC
MFIKRFSIYSVIYIRPLLPWVFAMSFARHNSYISSFIRGVYVLDATGFIQQFDPIIFGDSLRSQKCWEASCMNKRDANSQKTKRDWFLFTQIGSALVTESDWTVRWSEGKRAQEERYFISSLSADAERLAKAIRGHWGVENKCHWVLDVVFGEDQSSITEGYAPENLRTVNLMASKMLKEEKSCKKGIRAKQFKAALNNEYLTQGVAGR